MNRSTSVPQALEQHIRHQIATQSDQRIGFDTFMQHALYAPGMGYYSGPRSKIGLMPPGAPTLAGSAEAASGSDFATAPEMSSLFGKTLAHQVAQVLAVSGTDTIYEFGAGTGALAFDLLQTLGDAVRHYCIIDLSGTLRDVQQQRLRAFAPKVQWLEQLPDALAGVLLGNEVLDAMPVKLLLRQQGQWLERGVSLTAPTDDANAPPFCWSDRPTDLRPPLEVAGEHDYLTEIHPQAEAFIRTVGERLERGAALWIDYGFGEYEYYHPQRSMGTLVCHHQHRMDDNPLVQVGEKDITSHVNFTGIAVAAQEVGLEVLGYTTQGRFLINCGIAHWLEQATLPQRVMAAKLVQEHEMGELFKVMLLGRGAFWEADGFAHGDRTHTL